MEAYTIPLSQAEILQEGSDVTLVAWGTQVGDGVRLSGRPGPVLSRHLSLDHFPWPQGEK